MWHLRRAIYLWNVDDVYIVSVDVNCFIANYELLEILLLITEYVDASVTNVEVVTQLHNKDVVLRIILIKANHEETEMVVPFIGEEVELVLFVVVNDLFNTRYFVQLVQVHLLRLSQINVEAILLGCDNCAYLSIIQ